MRLTGPMTPHLAEELWQALGHKSLLADSPWPLAEDALLVDDTVTVAVQLNGKLRGTLQLPKDVAKDEAEKAALALPELARGAGRQDPQAGDRGAQPDRQRGGVTPPSPRGSSMARKPNYEFERRERDRLKAIKVAEKAQAKKEARERARLENAGPAGEADPAGDAEKT